MSLFLVRLFIAWEDMENGFRTPINNIYPIVVPLPSAPENNDVGCMMQAWDSMDFMFLATTRHYYEKKIPIFSRMIRELPTIVRKIQTSSRREKLVSSTTDNIQKPRTISSSPPLARQTVIDCHPRFSIPLFPHNFFASIGTKNYTTFCQSRIHYDRIDWFTQVPW